PILAGLVHWKMGSNTPAELAEKHAPSLRQAHFNFIAEAAFHQQAKLTKGRIFLGGDPCLFQLQTAVDQNLAAGFFIVHLQGTKAGAYLLVSRERPDLSSGRQ